MVRLICFFCLLTFSAATYAQDTAPAINKAGAQQLKTMFDTLLEERKKTLRTTSDTALTYQGSTSVEPQASYYAITLPYISLRSKDGNRIDLGMVSINAAPDTTAPKRWKMAIAIPTPIIMYDKNDQSILRFVIGAQKSAGIWDETVENFVKLDTLYANVSVRTTQDDSFALTIPQILTRYDFRKGEGTLLSGDGYIVAKDLALTMGNQFSGTLGSLRNDFTLKDFNTIEYAAHQKRISALTRRMTTDGVDKNALEKELLGTTVNLYKSFGEKLSTKYSLKNASITSKKDGVHNTVKIDDAAFGFDIGGFLSGKVFSGLTFGYNGLVLGSANLPQDIMPADVNFDIALKNLPLKELSSMGRTTAQSLQQNPDADAKAMIGLSLAMRLPALLSQAETLINLKNTYIGNKNYRLTLNGEAKADITAVNSITALLNGTFNGLDTLINRTRYYAKTDSQNAATYTNLLKQLQFMQTLGEKSGAGDTYLYKFEMTPTGQMLLNDKDAKKAIGGR